MTILLIITLSLLSIMALLFAFITSDTKGINDLIIGLILTAIVVLAIITICVMIKRIDDLENEIDSLKEIIDGFSM